VKDRNLNPFRLAKLFTPDEATIEYYSSRETAVAAAPTDHAWVVRDIRNGLVVAIKGTIDPRGPKGK